MAFDITFHSVEPLQTEWHPCFADFKWEIINIFFIKNFSFLFDAFVWVFDIHKIVRLMRLKALVFCGHLCAPLFLKKCLFENYLVSRDSRTKCEKRPIAGYMQISIIRFVFPVIMRHLGRGYCYDYCVTGLFVDKVIFSVCDCSTTGRAFISCRFDIIGQLIVSAICVVTAHCCSGDFSLSSSCRSVANSSVASTS